jgi:hypothetical protein
MPTMRFAETGKSLVFHPSETIASVSLVQVNDRIGVEPNSSRLPNPMPILLTERR